MQIFSIIKLFVEYIQIKKNEYFVLNLFSKFFPLIQKRCLRIHSLKLVCIRFTFHWKL